jgi:hypothetical protein
VPVGVRQQLTADLAAALLLLQQSQGRPVHGERGSSAFSRSPNTHRSRLAVLKRPKYRSTIQCLDFFG